VTFARKMLEPADAVAVFARSIERLGAATTVIGGTLGIRVHGERGGDWIVDLRTPGGVVRQPEGPMEVTVCNVVLYAEADAFSDFITQPDMVEQHIKSGSLAVDNDRARLTRIGHLLASSGNALSQRTRTAGATSPQSGRSLSCQST
jgi:hypothetical protein